MAVENGIYSPNLGWTFGSPYMQEHVKRVKEAEQRGYANAVSGQRISEKNLAEAERYYSYAESTLVSDRQNAISFWNSPATYDPDSAAQNQIFGYKPHVQISDYRPGGSTTNYYYDGTAREAGPEATNWSFGSNRLIDID